MRDKSKEPAAAFNQTNVELKQSIRQAPFYLQATFNQTNVELKQEKRWKIARNNIAF